MQKVDPRKLKADWSRYERRAPWSVVSSRELSFVLGVHLQTINNWSMRGILPGQELRPDLPANKKFYRIGSIRAWLNGTDEEVENWAWIKRHLPSDVKTLEHAYQLCRIAYEVLEVEKPI